MTVPVVVGDDDEAADLAAAETGATAATGATP